MISFKTTRLEREWESVDPRLKFLLYALTGYIGDFRVTCLVRTQEENANVGGHPRSKHLTGEAADVNPAREEGDPVGWRYRAKCFLDKHTSGVDSIIHGLPGHLHIEIDPDFPDIGGQLIKA